MASFVARKIIWWKGDNYACIIICNWAEKEILTLPRKYAGHGRKNPIIDEYLHWPD